MRLLPLVLLLIAGAFAQYKPIPRVQAIPLPYDQISFQRDEKEIARMHFGAELLRPFVYPIIGPSGRALTRMGHPGDPRGHSHHNSVWISLSKVNSANFWADTGVDRIRHRYTETIEDGERGAYVVTFSDWVDADGTVLLNERRHTGVKLLDGDEWMLLIDLELSAANAPVELGTECFGPIGVRMAKTLGAYHGGGSVRNSEGAEGEPAIFRKPARWVDYSGQSAPNVIEGLTLMDHPSNPRHPAPFHVREDGWMGAMLALDEPYRIVPGDPLHLRYALYVHRGKLDAAAMDAVWKRFAAEPLREPVGPPKTAADCRHGSHRRFTTPHAFATQKECEVFAATGN